MINDHKIGSIDIQATVYTNLALCRDEKRQFREAIKVYKSTNHVFLIREIDIKRRPTIA